MSESSKNASKSLKLTVPRSLMNIEDAEEIWTIITKRYPKAAPLLCEMEAVLDHAENLLEQLKSPSDVGIVLSSKDSLHVEEFGETVSNRTNLCESSISKSADFDTPNVSETQEYNFGYRTLTETVLTTGKNTEELISAEDAKAISTSFYSMYTAGEIDSLFDEVRDDRKESFKKCVSQLSEGSTQTALPNDSIEVNDFAVNDNKDARPYFASNVVEKPVPRLLQSSRQPRTLSEESRNIKTAIPKLKGSPRKHSNETEVSIPHFKKVVETIRSKEESSLKTDMKPQKNLEDSIVEIIRMKVKDSASIDGWDQVVGNSPKSSETSTFVNTVKLAGVTSTSTKTPSTMEENIQNQSKHGNHQKSEKMTKGHGYGDERISTSLANVSPVMILEQYAKVSNKQVDYIKNDDRKGKLEITCSFANYKVPSSGKVQEVVKNEAAAKMLRLLATSQMEENTVGNLQQFSRQQVLEIMKLDKGYTFIPSGTGRTDKIAKEKAAEDFYKKHFQKVKRKLQDS